MSRDSPVRCRIGDVVRCGTAISIEQDVQPAELATAVRREVSTPEAAIAVHAPSPTRVHEHVGCLTSGMGLRTQTALARAGRTRGLETPYDDELDEIRAELTSLSVESTTREQLRQTLAKKQTETEQLREQVATVRGKLQARRESDDGTDSTGDLEAAIRELSEVETTKAAVEQRLQQARENAQQRRERRERKRKLEDRLANRKREARNYLVDELREEYIEALSKLPEHSETPARPFDTEPIAAGLAIARVASLTAPVVLTCDQFESETAAADWLDATVLYI